MRYALAILPLLIAAPAFAQTQGDHAPGRGSWGIPSRMVPPSGLYREPYTGGGSLDRGPYAGGGKLHRIMPISDQRAADTPLPPPCETPVTRTQSAKPPPPAPCPAPPR